MKVVVMYRTNSEHGRKVEEFIHEFKRRYPQDRVDSVAIDSREGMAMASLYDITSYPGIAVLREDGTPSMMWQGDTLPLIDEVASYALH